MLKGYLLNAQQIAFFYVSRETLSNIKYINYWTEEEDNII